MWSLVVFLLCRDVLFIFFHFFINFIFIFYSEPNYFDETHLPNITSSDNWVICNNNLKSILKSIENYYKSINKRIIDLDTFDMKSISKDHDIDELLNFFELIIGIAVLCENKQVFIEKIFSLSNDTQYILKDFIERVMARLEDIDAEGDRNSSNDDNSNDSNTNDLQSIKNDRDRLIISLQSVSDLNTKLEEQVDQLTNQLAAQASIQEHKVAQNAPNNGNNDDKLQALQEELYDLRRDVDQKQLEIDELVSENRQIHEALTISREIQSKCELETHMMSDELEIARENGLKLIKAESMLEKYSVKLEEIGTLKAENKELLAKMDEYLEETHSLELSNTKYCKQIELLKNKNIEIENKQYELSNENMLLKEEIVKSNLIMEQNKTELFKLKEELKTKSNELRQLQLSASINNNELESISIATGNKEDEANETKESCNKENSISYIELREKCKKLELELNTLKKDNVSNSEGHEKNEVRSVEDSEIISNLQHEVEKLNKIRSEREESLLNTKKQVMELQLELQNKLKEFNELNQEYVKCQSNSKSEDDDLVKNELIQELKETKQQVGYILLNLIILKYIDYIYFYFDV